MSLRTARKNIVNRAAMIAIAGTSVTDKVRRLYIPAPLEDARFRKPERVIIKAHFLLMVIQENVLLHSLIGYIHVASLKTNVTTNMVCSVFPEGLVYKRFMLRY
jgi:hypothetical protein